MTRWSDVAGDDAAAGYDQRFAALVAGGTDVHGEAGLVERLLPAGASVLDAGCGTGRVAIELARRGFDCTGVDLDASMLARARKAAPAQRWVHGDLADLDLGAAYACVLAAGNVVPLLSAGTEPEVLRRLASHVLPGGLLVSGFGLDPAHLPLAEAPVDLASYDRWCDDVGLVLLRRLATWEGEPYDGGGYAVSVHRRESATAQQGRSSRAGHAHSRIGP